MSSISSLGAVGSAYLPRVASDSVSTTAAAAQAAPAAAGGEERASAPVRQRGVNQLEAMEQMRDKLRSSLGFGVTYGGSGAAPTGLVFRRDA